MRVWGRRYDSSGNYTWQAVITDPSGDNSYVYLLNLVQVLRLIRGESPFYANYGIPAIDSVLQQLFPDFFVSLTQSQFAPFFSSLIVARIGTTPPTYTVNALTKQGVAITPISTLPVGQGGAS